MVNIITIYSNNFGNRLQNFAMHKTLSRITGDSVVTLRIKDHQIFHSFINRHWKSLSFVKNSTFGNLLGGKRETLPFLAFTHNHIPTIQICSESINEIEGLFVIGSDQCWNPGWGLGAREDGAQCAIGVDPLRKVAYAASIGIEYENIPLEWQKRYASWLPSIGAISMREDSGASAVQKLTGRAVPVVLDPTMLLDATEWSKIEKQPSCLKELGGDYCLKYVLGDDTETERIDQIASELDAVVFDLRKSPGSIGPAEFLWLIRHAKIVCTDSFHGSVFSLIFHRPFVIFDRQDKYIDMSSRFQTLGRFPHVNAHRMNSDQFSWDAVWNMDWNAFEKELARRRASSLEWLESSIKRAGTE